MMEREESSQATFILALSTKVLGRTIVSFASSVGGGLIAKDQSDPYDLVAILGVPMLLMLVFFL